MGEWTANYEKFGCQSGKDFAFGCDYLLAQLEAEK